MYAWLWRHLPGTAWVRGAVALVATVVVVLALFTVVFPWIDGLLALNRVTVGE